MLFKITVLKNEEPTHQKYNSDLAKDRKTESSRQAQMAWKEIKIRPENHVQIVN